MEQMIMDSEILKRASKKLSWLLRHGATEAGVEMDPAGWVRIEDAARALRMDRSLIEDVVATNTKARFEIEGKRIRAVQGHSTAGVPISLDALEASWERYESEASVWHGTNLRAIDGIAEEGILPQARTHVHLAEATDSVVGKRAGSDLFLEVSPARLRDAGFGIFRSPNGVLLARCVPPSCIVGLVIVAKAKRAREHDLRARLGLPPVG
jgi:putative RNA 2'-phosphotransferase